MSTTVDNCLNSGSVKSQLNLIGSQSREDVTTSQLCDGEDSTKHASQLKGTTLPMSGGCPDDFQLAQENSQLQLQICLKERKTNDDDSYYDHSKATKNIFETKQSVNPSSPKSVNYEHCEQNQRNTDDHTGHNRNLPTLLSLAGSGKDNAGSLSPNQSEIDRNISEVRSKKRTLENAKLMLHSEIPKKQKCLQAPSADVPYVCHQIQNQRVANKKAERFKRLGKTVNVTVPANRESTRKNRVISKSQNFPPGHKQNVGIDFDLRNPSSSKSWQNKLSLALDKFLKKMRAMSDVKTIHKHILREKRKLPLVTVKCVGRTKQVHCESKTPIKEKITHKRERKKRKHKKINNNDDTIINHLETQTTQNRKESRDCIGSSSYWSERKPKDSESNAFPYCTLNTSPDDANEDHLETEGGRKIITYHDDDIFSFLSDSDRQPLSESLTQQPAISPESQGNNRAAETFISAKFPLMHIKVDELGKACPNGPCLYRCDFCKHVEPNITKIHDHLVSSLHYSASLCTVKVVDNTFEIVHMEKHLACKIEENQGVVYCVLCPQCLEVFPDIYICGLHSKLVHGCRNEVYSVCPVVQKSTEVVNNSHKCPTCKIVFPSGTALSRHRKAEPTHMVQKKRKVTGPKIGQDCVAVYQCPYCNVLYEQHGFNLARAHVLLHKLGKDDVQAVAVTTRQVKKPTSHEVLPPACPNKQPNNLWLEIETMERQVKYIQMYFTRNDAQRKCRAIRKEILRLKSLADTCATYGSKQTGLFHYVKPNSRS